MYLKRKLLNRVPTDGGVMVWEVSQALQEDVLDADFFRSSPMPQPHGSRPSVLHPGQCKELKTRVPTIYTQDLFMIVMMMASPCLYPYFQVWVLGECKEVQKCYFTILSV